MSIMASSYPHRLRDASVKSGRRMQGPKRRRANGGGARPSTAAAMSRRRHAFCQSDAGLVWLRCCARGRARSGQFLARRRKRQPGRSCSPAKTQWVAERQHRPMAVWCGRTERGLSQLAAGGITRKGRDDFEAGWFAPCPMDSKLALPPALSAWWFNFSQFKAFEISKKAF